MFVKGAYAPYLNKLYKYIVFPLNLIILTTHLCILLYFHKHQHKHRHTDIYSIHKHK